MKAYNSEELQNISTDFRNVARRLSRTDYSQCDANLKRFITFIDATPLIKSFIEANNTREYNVADVIKSRNWVDPFEVSHIMSDEISFEYQLLQYAIENFDGDFTRLYGTYHYIRAKSTTNDEMSAFIEHIIDPLIDYIADFIRKLHDKAVQEETNKEPSIPSSLSATNSTIVFNSSVGGDIATTVNLQSETKDSAQTIIKEITELLKSDKVIYSDEILEILESINDRLKENKPPQKGFLTALKSLCSGTTAIAGLAAALIKLFMP